MIVKSVTVFSQSDSLHFTPATDTSYSYFFQDTVPRLVEITTNSFTGPNFSKKKGVLVSNNNMSALRVQNLHPHIANTATPNFTKAVGAIPVTSETGITGAINYSVPIDMVAGLAGHQPGIGIAYSSQSGNDILGMGWSIGGLSSINSSNKTFYYDSKTEAAKLSKGDAFTLNGVALIKLSEDGTQINYETEQGNIKVNAYFTGNVIKYFQVLFPNGNKGIFGYTANTVQQLSYPLTSLEDINGNIITYTYIFRNQHYYITKIEYGGTATLPHFASIDFFYVTRSDVSILYVLGKTITEDYLLEKIETKSAANILRTYSFNYVVNNNQSLLTSINCSAGTESLNPLTFIYGEGGLNAQLIKQETQLLTYFPNATINNLIVTKGKFDYGTNNDGLIIYPNQNPYYENFQQGGLFNHSKKWYQSLYSPSQSLLVYQGLSDAYVMNATLTAGDGFIELFSADIDGIPGEEVIKVNNYGSNGYDRTEFKIYKPSVITGLSLVNTFGFNLAPLLTWYNTNSVHPKYFYQGDFNGDGIMEVLIVTGNNPLGHAHVNSKIYIIDLKTGLKTFEGAGLLYKVDYANNLDNDYIFSVDYDGDGKTDIIHVHDTGTDVFTFDITGTTYTLRKVATNTNFKKSDIKNKQFSLGELNGDGLIDFLIAPNESYYQGQYHSIPVNTPAQCNVCYFPYEYNGFSGFFQCQNCSNFISPSTTCIECFSLLNADGGGWGGDPNNCPTHGTHVTRYFSTYVDNGNTWTIFHSKGDGSFEKKLLAIKNREQNEKIILQDVNADGISDLITNKNGYLSAHLVYNGIITTLPVTNNWVNNGSYVIPSEVSGYNYHSQLLSIYNDKVTRLTFTRNDAKERVITGSVNSFGVVTKHLYQQLNEGVNQYGSYNSLYHMGYGAVFPYENYQGPLLVGAQSERWLNNVLIDQNTFAYENAIVHRQGLGLRGFTKIYTYDEIRNRQTSQTFDPVNFGTLINQRSPMMSSLLTYNISVAGNKIAKVNLTSRTDNDLLKATSINTAYTYDSYGNVLTETVDFGGGDKTITTNVYNNSVLPARLVLGILIAQSVKNEKGSNAINYSKTYTYNSAYKLTGVLHKRETNTLKEEAFRYDIFGNITESKVKPFSATHWLTHTYTYSSNGRFLATVTNPYSHLSGFNFSNSTGMLTSKTDHKSNVTSFEYDGWQRIKKVTHPGGIVLDSTYNWITSGNNNSLIGIVSSATGSPAVKLFLDALEREKRKSVTGFDGADIHVDKLYDNYGRLTQTSLPFNVTPGYWNITSFDQYDRVSGVTPATGAPLTISYSGNTVTETKNSLPETKTYDARGRLSTLTNTTGTINYSYHADGQMASVMVSPGITTSFEYDNFGRQIKIIDPSAGDVSYGYDVNGNINAYTNAKGDIITSVFDNSGRLITQTRPEFSTTYTYNTDGDITAVNNTNASTRLFEYDNLRRVTKVTENVDAENFIINFGYENGKIKQETYTTIGQTLNYQYNAHGYLYRITNGANIPVKTINSMSVNGLVTETEFNNGLKQQYSYGSSGLLTGIKTMNGLTAIQDYGIGIEPLTGNILYRKDNGRNIQENFTYDATERLTGYGSSVLPQTITYNNATGNMLTKTDAGEYKYSLTGKPYTQTGLISTLSTIPQQLQEITYSSFARPKQLTENGYETNLSYDETYNRTKMVVKQGGSLLYTRYYFAGGRLEKTVHTNPVNNRSLFYIDGTPYTAGVVNETTNPGDRILYISRDHLGSITHITNTAKTVVAEYSYDAWGRLRNPVNLEVYNTVTEPLLLLNRGYTGHEHLKEFSLVNMNARLYDPLLGKMLSPDGFIQDERSLNNFNRYSYAMNNPIRYNDPTGNIILEFIVGFIDGFFRNSNNRFANGWAGARAKMEVSHFLLRGQVEGNFGQILSRHTVEAFQNGIGLALGQWYNITKRDVSVDYFAGATVLTSPNINRSSRTQGNAATIGSYMFGNSNTLRIRDNNGNLNDLFMHEYGHYLQSQRSGLLYIYKYGLPSARHKEASHSRYWTEMDANARSFDYFSKRLQDENSTLNWNNADYPIGEIRNFRWWEAALHLTNPLRIFWINL